MNIVTKVLDINRDTQYSMGCYLTNEYLEKYFYAIVRRCKVLIHECLDVDVGERGH